MLTEHSVTYKQGGMRRVVTRCVFDTRDGRILGSEDVVTHRYCGYDGWQWTGAPTVTRAFRTKEEASAWLDDMFREHDVWMVAQGGGTKLVFA